MSKGARDRREPKRPVSVAFYSYKGGTGRSLMLAQLAVCLARLGKSVCVLDFDLEAPGIEYKFRGLDPELQHPKCEGLAMYVQAFVEVAAHSMIRACPSCGNDLPWQLDPSKTLTLPII
ncbi:MAG: P-loop NTPase, partial [Coriobacteriales bacterium]